MISPGMVTISRQLNITVNTLSQSTSWLVLVVGIALFIASPTIKIYGKRPIYILAGSIMFSASVWGAESRNYKSFLGSRVFAGLGMAPYEVLAQCSIGDMYFVHQVSWSSSLDREEMLVDSCIAWNSDRSMEPLHALRNCEYPWF